jgi:hypothetical protein
VVVLDGLPALGSRMKETTRNFPPHSQRRGSVWKTLRMRFAHRLRRAARCLESGRVSSVSEEGVREAARSSSCGLWSALAREE